MAFDPTPIQETEKKILDKNMLGDTKADIAIVNILNEIQNKRLTRRVAHFLGDSVSFLLNTIKIIPTPKNTRSVATQRILYGVLKKYFSEKVDELLLYGHEELRIPIQCSVATRLKRYFIRKANKQPL